MKDRKDDDGIKYLFYLLIITCLIFTLLFPGCNQAVDKLAPPSSPPQTPTSNLTLAQTPATPPTGPISAYFSISESPLLGKPVELTLTFTMWERLAPDAPNTTARIILPEGFELVNGDLEWKGSTSRGETYKVTATIKSIKTGEWVIGGSIRYSQSKGGNLVGTDCSISVAVFEDAVIVKGRGIEEKIRTKIFLSNPPELGKPVTLTFAFAIKEGYKQDAPGTTARIVLPEGFELVDGDLQWEGDLTRDTTIQIKATIKAVKTGAWRIRTVASFSPYEGIYLGGSDVLFIEYYEDGTFNIGGSGDPFQPWWQSFLPVRVPEPRLKPISYDNLSITTGKDGRFNDPLTITGNVTCYVSENNLPSSGTPRDDVEVPMVWGGVYIHHASTGVLLGSTSTEPEEGDGGFSVVIENPGEQGFYVLIRPHTTIAKVTDKNGSVWASYGGTYYPDSEQGTINLPPKFASYNGNLTAVWRIYETIADDDYDRGAWDFLKYEGPGYEMPQRTVVYDPDDVNGTRYDKETNKIYIASDNHTKALDTVQHEYGHAVMDYVYGDLPETAQEHDIPYESDNVTAWVEGWADLFPLIVQNEWDPVYEYGGAEPQRNLELPTWDNPLWWDDGDDVEGRVAGALWDIFDSNNDTCDRYNGGFGTTWDTFTGNTSDNFSEFWGAWQEEKPEDRFDALQSIYQNTIPYSAEFEIDDLFVGLNLMSLPLIPEETDPSVALDGINCGALNQWRHPSGPDPTGYVTYINGDPYDPESGFKWADGIGTWITMGDPADNLLIDGHILDPYPYPPPAYLVYEGVLLPC